MEEIIIKITGDAKDLDSTISKLEKLGVIDKQNAESFKKTNVVYKQQGGIINDLKKKVEELTAARDRSNNPAAIARFNALIGQSKQKMAELTGETKKVTQQVGQLNGVMSNIGGALAGALTVGAVIGLGKAIFDITAKFQKYEAVLTNVLGSQELAKQTLGDIAAFAAKTNFSVDELTASYIKLANQGFKPTQDELLKLADLANSQGKSFDQLTEAIIDAQTGEFERLKEFGIRASKQGDQVKFTFKGVEQQVDFTSDAIREYVLGLGNLNGVSGSTVAISKTLEGQVSNLGDNFDNLLLKIGQSGQGGLADAIGLLNDGLQELGNALSDKPSKFDELKEAILAIFRPIGDLFESLMGVISTLTGATEKATMFEGIMKVLGFTLKLSTLPLKLLIQGWVTLFDTFTVGVKAVKNLYAAITGGAQVDSGLSKLKEDFKEFIDIITLSSGDFEHAKEKERIATEETKKVITKSTKEISDANKKAHNERLDQLQELAEFNKKVQEDLEKEEFDRLNAIKAEEEKIGEFKRQQLENYLKEQEEAENERIRLEEEAAKKREEIAKAEADRKREINQAVQDFTFETIGAITNALQEASQIRTDNELAELDIQTENQLAAIDKRLENGLLSENAAEVQREQLKKRAADKEKAIKTKQAQTEKAFALFQIGISTAQAIVKQLAVTPLPAGAPLVALIAAAGAIQAAIVASKPIPKFGKGGMINGRSHANGGVDINAEGGEFVMRKEVVKGNEKFFEALNRGNFRYQRPGKSLKEARESNMIDAIVGSMGGDFTDRNIVGAINKMSSRMDNSEKIAKKLAKELRRNPDHNRYAV